MPTLVRRLGLWSSIGIVIGITIGGGIFRTPAGIATRVPEPTMMLAVWIIGGLVVLCGALAFAELAASMPETGGMYVYLREGWGRPYAFLYGWAQLVLIRAAGARRHFLGIRRVLPARVRHRPGGPSRLGRLPRGGRHRLCRRRQHRRRPARRAASPACRRSRSSARWRCWSLLSFAARRQTRRELVESGTDRRAGRRRACSAWR